MTPIGMVVARVVAQPAPVLILDTCNFLDLFRRDSQRPKAPADEMQFAVELLQLAVAQPNAVHLIVPELVPGEYADHADRIEREFDGWFELHDENQDWLVKAAVRVDVALPAPVAVHPLGLSSRFRRLADDLLARATVLGRDLGSLDRAVARLLAKRRPSHNKDIKDSMNLEQSLEFCSQLRRAGFTRPTAFLSSNTKDFAATPTSGQLHEDLRDDFAVVSLEYFANLRAAVGPLRKKGELP